MRARVAMCVAALACGCSAPASSGAVTPPATDGGPPIRRLIYAAVDDGTIHVYDISAGHAEIGVFGTVTGVSDVRGACATRRTRTTRPTTLSSRSTPPRGASYGGSTSRHACTTRSRT